MNRLITLAASALLTLHAASFGVAVPIRAIAHPVAAFHSAPRDVRFLHLGVAVVETLNFSDYEMTKRSVFNGPFCEQNRLFLSAPCVIDRRLFTGVKLGVAAFGFVQEAPEFFPAFRAWRWRATFERVAGIADIAVAVPLGIAVANNIRVLQNAPKGK